MTDVAGKSYDYSLKFLLVGDSDVGKDEFLSGLQDGYTEYGHSNGIIFKTAMILLDGKRIKLQLWDTSGQGRFCTIFRSYSRGAQGVLLVYDITNRWSFDGIDRWIKEIHQHAPGIPKILIGNRLHLEFNRQVHLDNANEYADRNDMTFLEVSPLCDYNITESLIELARVALARNGISRHWLPDKVLSLQESCCRTIASCTCDQNIDDLYLPTKLKVCVKSYLPTQLMLSQRYQSMSREKRTASNLGQSSGGTLMCLPKKPQFRCVTPHSPPDRKSYNRIMTKCTIM